MASGTPNRDGSLRVDRATLVRNGDLAIAPKVRARQGAFFSQERLERSAGDDLAAVPTGARSEVDQIIGDPDRVFVVLHHNDRISEIP